MYTFGKEYVDHKKIYMKTLHRFLKSGEYILGKSVERLEKKIEALFDNPSIPRSYSAIGTSSGSDSLKLILKAINIKNQEVLLSSYTFISVPNVIIELGGIPVFIDNDPFSYDMNFDLIKKYLDSKKGHRVKAIIFTHLFGSPSSYSQKIYDLELQYGIFTIEDACQSFSASYQNQLVGSFSSFSFFSFYPTKIFSGYGDGGLVLSSIPFYSAMIKKMRNHGNHGKCFGYNARLDELQAALLLIKLNLLPDLLQKTRFLASLYESLISHWINKFSSVDSSTPILKLQSICYSEHQIQKVYPFFPIEVNPKVIALFISILKKNKISFRRYYRHFYGNLSFTNSKYFKVPFGLNQRNRLSKSVICLPLSIYQKLDDTKKILYTLEYTFKNIFKRYFIS